MELLALAALIWLDIHIGLAGTAARRKLVGRFGENEFRGGYSAVSLVSMVLLVAAYQHAPVLPLWVPPHWLQYLAILAMLPASILLVAAVMGPNPTAVNQQGALGQPARGIQRITRHPMLCAFAIWASVHLLMNGDWASLIFFGAFAATAMAGMPSIDRKLAERDPENWRRLSATTSIVPGLAILEGRNRFVPEEIPNQVIAFGAGLWALLIIAHRIVIGVSVWPH